MKAIVIILTLLSSTIQAREECTYEELPGVAWYKKCHEVPDPPKPPVQRYRKPMFTEEQWDRLMDAYWKMQVLEKLDNLNR